MLLGIITLGSRLVSRYSHFFFVLLVCFSCEKVINTTDYWFSCIPMWRNPLHLVLSFDWMLAVQVRRFTRSSHVQYLSNISPDPLYILSAG